MTRPPSSAVRLAASALALAALVLAPFTLPDFLVFQMGLMLSYALAILGLNLLLGYAGQVCLAQGAFFACGAYTTAILTVHAGVPPLVTLPAAAAVTALVGVIVGLPALRLGGLQLGIVTFGIASLVPQALLKFPSATGGVSGLSFEPPAAPAWLPVSQQVWLYFLCLACFGLCALVMAMLVGGFVGRTLRALRDNPLVAESLGVDLVRARLAAFLVSSAFAGLGGGLYALINAYISPQSFLATRSIDILIGSIVGGATSLWGALGGAIFVVFVPEWTSEMNPAAGGLIYGLCLLVAMLLFRDGAAGLARTLSAGLSAGARGRAGTGPAIPAPARTGGGDRSTQIRRSGPRPGTIAPGA
ncbi:MAG: branched-chain amino acid ABC transporter permease [Methylobacterium frigidaeris]